MPSEPELERRFNEVLIQMDLPPERAKILKGFSNEKKWDTVCDHDLVHAKAVCGNMILKQVFRSVFDPGFFDRSGLKSTDPVPSVLFASIILKSTVLVPINSNGYQSSIINYTISTTYRYRTDLRHFVWIRTPGRKGTGTVP